MKLFHYFWEIMDTFRNQHIIMHILTLTIWAIYWQENESIFFGGKIGPFSPSYPGCDSQGNSSWTPDNLFSMWITLSQLKIPIHVPNHIIFFSVESTKSLKPTKTMLSQLSLRESTSSSRLWSYRDRPFEHLTRHQIIAPTRYLMFSMQVEITPNRFKG